MKFESFNPEKKQVPKENIAEKPTGKKVELRKPMVLAAGILAGTTAGGLTESLPEEGQFMQKPVQAEQVHPESADSLERDQDGNIIVTPEVQQSDIRGESGLEDDEGLREQPFLNEEDQQAYIEISTYIKHSSYREVLREFMNFKEGRFADLSPDVVSEAFIEILNSEEHKSDRVVRFILDNFASFQSSQRAVDVFTSAVDAGIQYADDGGITAIRTFLRDLQRNGVSPDWLPSGYDHIAQNLEEEVFMSSILGLNSSQGLSSLDESVRDMATTVVEKYYGEQPLEILSILRNANLDNSDQFKILTNLFEGQSSEFISDSIEAIADDPQAVSSSNLFFLSIYEKWSEDPRSEEFSKVMLMNYAKSASYGALPAEDTDAMVYGRSWAADYYIDIIQLNPKEYFKYYQYIEDAEDSSILNFMLPLLADKYPEQTLEYYQNDPGAPKALSLAQVALQKTDPVESRLFLDSMQDSPDFEALQQGAPQNIEFELSLLARNRYPRYQDLRKQPAFSEVYRIDRTLVYPLFDTYQFNLTPGENQRELTPDEINILTSYSQENDNMDPVAMANAVAMVARNLYSRNKEFTDQNVQEEVSRILQTREALEKVDLFGGNVILATHEQRMSQDDGVHKAGDPMFGPEALVSALRDRAESNQSGGAFEHFVVDESSSPESVRAQTLDAIENSLDPVTIFFDGHGGPDAVYFSDGSLSGEEGVAVNENDQTVKIDAERFAEALQRRYLNQGSPNSSNIKLVFNACFTNDLFEDIVRRLDAADTPVPEIMLGVAQFGQTSYSDFGNETGSDVSQWLVESPSVGDLIQNEGGLPSNTFIFVPDTEDPQKSMQISGNFDGQQRVVTS